MSVRSTIRLLWARHRLLTVVFAAALFFTILFTARSIAFYIYWSQHRNVPVEAWMPVGYVARAYGLARDDLAAELHIERGDRRPLVKIAEERGIPVSQLIAEVDAAIAKARKAAGTQGGS